ncbi:hypothetical protein [Flavobacterium sp.]|jgi:uncharacterized protein YqhQ|uniref:hypothetical protein n=1 Tax=Flavobacterium sp. TaxID=239 RepID=UPI002A811078|nr:hypothetical protein [Flavobacterium sp.]
MENIATNIDKLYQKAEQYSKTTLELVKLKTIDKTTDIISSLAVSLIMIIIAAIFTMFINIGIALWLGDVFNNMAMGFFVISGFYLIVGIIVYLNKDYFIKTPVNNLVIKKLLESKTSENDTDINTNGYE